jgi:hypothetical protein
MSSVSGFQRCPFFRLDPGVEHLAEYLNSPLLQVRLCRTLSHLSSSRTRAKNSTSAIGA